MTDTPSPEEADMTEQNPTTTRADDDAALLAEDLIEEVSIDGMCGVY